MKMLSTYLITVLSLLLASASQMWSASEPLQKGAVLNLEGRTATLLKLETLPYVESEYTKRFRFDSYENQKLKQLRLRYHLDDVVASGQDEFAKQILLMDWTHKRFKKFGRPSTAADGALDVLEAIENGQTFFCKQYAEVLVSAAACLGWVDRPLALRRHQGVAKVGGSTEHSVTEIWSNQHRKWVMLDPTSNMYLERDGTPLNAYEIRQEWFYHSGTNLVFVVGKERKRYKKSDLPIFLERFADFGDLAVYPDELDKYGFTAYIPNTDIMDSGFDYGKMFIVKDQLCDGTKWHVRTIPANPAVDPYFPIGQVAMSLTVDGGQLNARLKTLTPNFLTYEVRFDGAEWKPSAQEFSWSLHAGLNRVEAKTVNKFGVEGPVSVAEVEVK